MVVESKPNRNGGGPYEHASFGRGRGARFAGGRGGGAAELHPNGDVSFVCGAKNPEDLVLVPGTQWIVSSGMAEGAGFYLVDSRTGTAARCRSPRSTTLLSRAARRRRPPQTLNTHGLNIRATARRSRELYVVGHGAREAIEVFDVDASGRAADVDLAWLRADARRSRGQQRRVVRRRLARRDRAVHARHDVRRCRRRP